MESGSIRRRIVAIAAAYAVALQALLMAFVPVQLAALSDPLAVLCSHDAGNGGQPAQHDMPCAAICAAMGHGIAGAVPPDVVAAIAIPFAVIAALFAGEWVPPLLALADDHAPRGPPLP